MKSTDIKEQSAFCDELMKRLDNDIQKANPVYGCIQQRTRLESDIIRLRRELNTLNRMLNTYCED